MLITAWLYRKIMDRPGAPHQAGQPWRPAPRSGRWVAADGCAFLPVPDCPLGALAVSRSDHPADGRLGAMAMPPVFFPA